MFHVGSYRFTLIPVGVMVMGVVYAGCMWILTCRYAVERCGMWDVYGYIPVGMMVKGVVCWMFVVTYLWV